MVRRRSALSEGSTVLSIFSHTHDKTTLERRNDSRDSCVTPARVTCAQPSGRQLYEFVRAFCIIDAPRPMIIIGRRARCVPSIASLAPIMPSLMSSLFCALLDELSRQECRIWSVKSVRVRFERGDFPLNPYYSDLDLLISAIQCILISFIDL